MFLCDPRISRYDEQAKMVNDLNSVLQTIQDRLKECQQWDVQHQVMIRFEDVGLKISLPTQCYSAGFLTRLFFVVSRLRSILYVEQSWPTLQVN